MDNRKASFASIFVYVAVSALAVTILGIGLYRAAGTADRALLAAGLLAVLVTGISWPIMMAILSLSRSQRTLEDSVKGANERLDQMAILLNLMSEQQLLSDRAKAVAFRDHDRDALRRAIREEMGQQDWEAALVLANEIEKQFGYTSEADSFREEIRGQRQENTRKQIAEVMTVIDRHCRNEDWVEALRETEKLMKRFPGEESIRNLPQEIENRRLTHKKQLLASWQEAVNRRDVDGAVEILKKLDAYLTPEEAEPLQEAARDIFKAKLENLRMQFANATQDHQWSNAIRIGEEITQEFPNSRLAHEVKDLMPTLRERAATAAAV